MKKTILTCLVPLVLAGSALGGDRSAPAPASNPEVLDRELCEAWMLDFNGQGMNRHYLTGDPIMIGSPMVAYLEVDARAPKYGYWFLFLSTDMAPPQTMVYLDGEVSQLFLNLRRVFYVENGAFDFRGGAIDRGSFDFFQFPRKNPIRIQGPRIPNAPALLGKMWFAQAAILQPTGTSLSSLCGGAVGNYHR